MVMALQNGGVKMGRFMKAEEVAVELGISMATVYNYRRDGLLHQEQVGRKRYFVREQVLALKAQLQQVSLTKAEVAA